MKAAHQCYKRHHDTQMGEEMPFHADQLGFVDPPPLSTPTADRMAVETYSKLLPRALGLYLFLSTTEQTVPIYQDVILNTISSGRAALASDSMQRQSDIFDGEQQTPSLKTPDRNPMYADDQLGQEAKEGSTAQYYTVDHIMKYVSNIRKRNYVVRWY